MVKMIAKAQLQKLRSNFLFLEWRADMLADMEGEYRGGDALQKL